ncbi:MAG TPA: hypothetical protein DIC52_07365 [Candidatus Latescibacteria bacterium]|nr:hypothetical protein [Candidatus Latescibacterota bacterium]
MSRSTFALCCLIALTCTSPITAEPTGDTDDFIDARSDTWAQVALQIWDWAELGYKEERSSALLQQHLRDTTWST